MEEAKKIVHTTIPAEETRYTLHRSNLTTMKSGI